MAEEPPAFPTYRLTLVYWDKTVHYTMIWSHNEAIDGKATISEVLPLCELPLLCCLVSHVWLFDPMDCCWPGSSVRGISQARILEWVALSFSRGSSWPRDWTCIGRRILYHSASREALVVLLLWQNSPLPHQFLAFDSGKQQEKQIRFVCFLPRVLC